MSSKQLELHEFVNKKNIVNYLSFNFLILQGVKVTVFCFKNTLNDIIPKVSLKYYNNRYSSQKSMGLILKIHPKIHCTTIIQNDLLNSCDKSLMFYLKNIDSRDGAIPPLLMDKCKIDLVSLLKGTNLKWDL